MSVTRNDGSTTFTGADVEGFRLLALRHALGLESIGLKRRGTSALSLVKEVTGLKARTAKEMEPKYEKWLIEMGILTVNANQSLHYVEQEK